MTPPVASRRVPSSTYRLQLSAAFTLADAERIVPYLDALGVGAVYLSPCLESKPGSPHGYDIVDHNRVDPELGGQPAFESLAGEVARRGMGLLVDFVPNHMAADASANRWWAEVLENGACSPYADYFAIDNGYIAKSTGFGNGDFNYDGSINIADYFLIDDAYIAQQSGLLAASADAVPEPGTLSLLALGAGALLGRRRKSR